MIIYSRNEKSLLVDILEPLFMCEKYNLKLMTPLYTVYVTISNLNYFVARYWYNIQLGHLVWPSICTGIVSGILFNRILMINFDAMIASV